MVRHDLGGRTIRVTVNILIGLTVQDCLYLTVEYCSCWWLKALEVDGSSRGYELRTYVTGCQTFMRHATCHFLIGFCTGLKRRFVFRASFIYITHLFHLISTIFSQNLLSQRSRQPCQRTPSNIYTCQLYNCRLSVTQSGECLSLFIFSVLHFVLKFC